MDWKILVVGLIAVIFLASGCFRSRDKGNCWKSDGAFVVQTNDTTLKYYEDLGVLCIDDMSVGQNCFPEDEVNISHFKKLWNGCERK